MSAPPLPAAPKPRRAYRTGTIEGPNALGLYRFKCPDGTGKSPWTPWMFESYDIADTALIAHRRNLAMKTVVPKEGVTLDYYYDHHFKPEITRIRRPGTVQTYDQYYARISRGLGSTPLQKLTRKGIKKWAKKQDVAHPENFVARLHAILQMAIEDEFLETNPADHVKLESRKRNPDELRPTPEEQEALLTCPALLAALPDWYAAAFALGAGLRPGEWRNLELVDVHLDAAQPYVLVQYGTDGHGTTKNGEKRRVPLFGLALDALKAWLPLLPQHHPENALKLVFPSATGGRRSENTPFGRIGPREKRRGKFAWYLEQAGITRHLTPHSLRHGCATDLLTGTRGERLEVWQVQVLLGHKKITTTLKYIHPGERDLFASLAKQSSNRPEQRPPSPEPLQIRPFAPPAAAGGRDTNPVSSATSIAPAKAAAAPNG